MKLVQTPTTVSLEFDTSKLSTRQRYILATFLKEGDTSSATCYLSSFNGRRRYVDVGGRRRVRTTDKLESRGSGYYLAKHLEGMRYTGASFRPDETIPDGLAIGVEIECFIPIRETTEWPECNCLRETEDSDCYDDCASNSLRRENRYNQTKRIAEVFRRRSVKRVSIKDDGSLRAPDGYDSFEFTCLTRSDNVDNLRRLCDALKELGATVNQSCGLHVHLDARDDQGRVIANRLKTALPFLTRLIPQTRLNNQYCRSDISKRGERYAKINKESLRKFRTIEVRMHSGTTDFVKINNWIRVLLAVARGPKRLSATKAASPLIALATLGLPMELNAWVLERITKFYGPQLDAAYTAENGNERAA